MLLWMETIDTSLKSKSPKESPAYITHPICIKTIGEMERLDSIKSADHIL